ncbi:MAG: PfaD family polyunsaturated fatty acid/polyketide biosynthesis protein [Thermodesulfobacteriota bacterium]|nr:PfaD family polyunsaturated fatty acid/polyketide biosynthesis protein [Thermodesulfobacteriota bacterium]
MADNGLRLSNNHNDFEFGWDVDDNHVSLNKNDIKNILHDFESPVYIVKKGGEFGASQNCSKNGVNKGNVVAFAPAYGMENLGDPEFRAGYGVKYNYYAGAMANGIASEEMVIALGKAGFLASFGAGGLVPSRIEEAVRKIQKELPKGPYAFNLIHSPMEPGLEKGAVDLYLKYGVTCVEAAAFINLTPYIVYYRVAGLKRSSNNEIIIGNKIIAKISRNEVAIKFMEPAPDLLVQKLFVDGLITKDQVEMAKHVPMADDITAEADSGGHTDNRPMVSLLPSIIALKDEVQAKHNYREPLRVGVGGGIGTPGAALAAFSMGAAFVVTGSVNQACIESGSCEHTKKLLANADMADVTMAPASDMFEMGVKLQVLKRGTLFAMRAQKLYNIYSNYNSIDEIPADERTKIEKQIFKKNLDEIWEMTIEFFNQRDPGQIKKAENNPKRKMALIFRWYLGLASRWSNIGEKGREMDYQIWCGPSMGAFNSWVKNSYLEKPENRTVVDVAKHILTGAAYLYRIQNLAGQGIHLSPDYLVYLPEKKVNTGLLE